MKTRKRKRRACRGDLAVTTTRELLIGLLARVIVTTFSEVLRYFDGLR